MTPSSTARISSRRIADELRRIRVECGMAAESVAARLVWSPSKLSRVETFTTGVSLRDLERLLAYYRQQNRVPECELDAVLNLARKTAGTGPMSGGEEPNDHDEVSAVLEWAAITVPALLRTEDYALAVLRSMQPSNGLLPRDIARAVAEMVRWQRRLTEDSPLVVEAVLDESVLQRQFGSVKVMRAQLDRLLEVAELPSVELRVLPIGQGAARALTPFRYDRFDDLDGISVADAVVVDRLRGSTRFVEEHETYPYLGAFAQLKGMAASPTETARMIRGALRKL